MAQQDLAAPASRLLTLPIEVRLQIYGYIVDSPKSYERGKSPGSSAFFVGLLCVCRQIHAEVTPLIYKTITIDRPLDHWSQFLHQIGPHNVSMIRNLTIYYPSFEPSESLQVLQSLTRQNNNIQTLKVEVEGSEIDQPLNMILLDLKFLSYISRLRNAQEIELIGAFNPLWGFFLHQRLGFILRRGNLGRAWGPSWQWSHWRLINPAHLCTEDLADCIKHLSLDGVYDQKRRVAGRRNWVEV
ncbi:hypothetical protein F5B20DRAFT_592581 [Whalleya microplaca]|nr:hypothetical protein F5B20DRAFT_592581 [Whalleya microplaca]